MMTTLSRRARLLEYLPWMLRDYFTNQGPSTAIVALLFIFMTIVPVVSGMGGPRAHFGHIPLQSATNMLRSIVGPVAFFGTFFATNGIIANDRKLGYYRFLFAKPVAPATYYATTFFVYGAGLLVVSAVILGAWALAVRPMFPPDLFFVVAIIYVSYGGIGFLLSAAWRFDWLSLVSVLLVANVGWSLWGNTGGVRHWVLYLLPPVHRANEVFGMVLRSSGAAIPWASIAWLAGYGAGCFLIGILVVRRRPLSTS